MILRPPRLEPLTSGTLRTRLSASQSTGWPLLERSELATKCCGLSTNPGLGPVMEIRMGTEQEYDEIIAPMLLEVARKVSELGMSLIARVEWEPGESGITQIGDLNSIGQFM